MTTLRMIQVDVFSEHALAGNPLAVFPQAEGLSDEQMQQIASEMNLSETTFVTPARAGGSARVRIFTPGTELPFAGHPSVGTACTLVNLGIVAPQEPVTEVVLELNVGPTPVDVTVRGGQAVAGVVHQGPPTFGEEIPRDEAARILRLQPGDLDEELVPAVVGTGLSYAIIPLRNTRALAHAWYDIDLLPEFERRYAELYPFAFTGDEEPFVEARCFAPAAGIVEDPATGSAAGPLAAYLARAGLLAPGAARVLSQGRHVRRPSRLTISVSLEGTRMTDVLVGGGVVPVMTGELTI
ncbi:MAG TPA: PhzF family phenazine biosynthesis protein [Thermoleophilia bacterium]|nr:PhzF family phenazine biosynthesis protein [Thermoleophilia bacterium]